MNHDLPDDDRDNLYSIPDIDIPPSPPPPAILSSPEKKTSPVINEETTILNILTRPSSLPRTLRSSDPSRKKPPVKRKKKKKPMSEYRPPSPFSPKPDYKSLDVQQLKTHAMRYGISNSLAKGRLIKVLDEIYNQTHQYETDTDFEYEPDAVPKQRVEKKDLARTPPTPAAMPDLKKVKKRPVVHQMSSSDEMEQEPRPALVPPAQNSPSNTTTDDDDAEHEGRFLELTVYNLSSSTSSSRSVSTIDTPPKLTTDAKGKRPSSIISLDSFLLESPTGAASQASSTGKSKSQPVTAEPDSKTKKKAAKKPKLETPTLPLKDIVRSYIEANPILHARILSYEPIDFEEFHNQMKSELNLKIVSKELMQCLDDQCITFTLRARKGAFTSVMRAKRRHK